jgi:ubiquinone/menaquinone biosynthesis C-methylase UbiE
MKRNYPYSYDLATGLYDRLARQKYWDNSISELTRFAFSELESNHLNILDIGCGPGNSTTMIALECTNSNITGVDISTNMINRANKKLRREKETSNVIAYVRSDAASLPFPDNYFDLVTGHSFLYMVRNKKEVMQELARVLKPGGQIAFLEPGTSINAVGRSALLKDNIRNPKPYTRLQTKLLLIRIYSTRKGLVTPSYIHSIFDETGLSDFIWKEAMGGRALLFKAKKK